MLIDTHCHLGDPAFDADRDEAVVRQKLVDSGVEPMVTTSAQMDSYVRSESIRMGKIIKDKYPELDDEDQEAVRQHAVAALNLTQQAKKIVLGVEELK